MKIPMESLQPKPVQQIEGRADSQSTVARNGTETKQLPKDDIVKLSASMDKELGVRREAFQAQRVASIKAQLTAGTYQVSSRLVAEKMLSEASGI